MACDCECPSGNYSCPCCCASVTGLRAGIHPDLIKSAWKDVFINTADTPTKTHETVPLLTTAAHIVSVTASLACVKRISTGSNLTKQIEEPGSGNDANVASAVPTMFSLFTIPGWNDAGLAMGGWNNDGNAATELDARTHCVTGALSPRNPSWQSPPDLFGYFCDGGLFVEMNAPQNQTGIRIVVNYIDRLQFSPAYGDPVQVLQHYWTCAHDNEFLDGFYGGVSFDESSEDSEPSYSESTGATKSTNPFTPATTVLTNPPSLW